MAGKGAPEGNQYAKKEEKGRTISLYLSGDDFALIRQILQDRGEDSSDEKCIELAKMAAKSGIYQLLIAKKSEDNQSLETAMRETVDKLFKMVRTSVKQERKKTTMGEKLKQALETFLEDDNAFASAIISSTNAGFSGSGYSVELFLDGSHRVIWNDAIGNRYEPEGLVLGLPKLSDEDYQDLCKVAGDDTSDTNLASELQQWAEGMMEMADDMRKDLDDRLTMRQA